MKLKCIFVGGGGGAYVNSQVYVVAYALLSDTCS